MVAELATTRSVHDMVCTVDERATGAAIEILARGGTAVDAALAANAVLAVVAPHMCGLGGDLFAIVHDGRGAPVVLNASGRAGSGAQADAVRAEGHTRIPNRHHIAAVTVPGCVDGWMELHARFGRLPMVDLVAEAVLLADEGFWPDPLLVAAGSGLAGVSGVGQLADMSVDRLVARPGVAEALRAVAADGRVGFYQGEFGRSLLEVGAGWFEPGDLARSQADWVSPTGLRLHGHDVWTVPPNSQGYLSLSAAWIAARIGWPADLSSPDWAHLGIEAARAAAFDRHEVLFEGAGGDALLAEERLAPRAARLSWDTAAVWDDQYRDGGTMYLCVVDDAGMGVSLIQSNAQDFGSYLAAGDTGILLHNRGIGFSLVEGHAAELGPGRRPPHTLSPAMVTTPGGDLRAVLGTMGGDAQPQVVLQMLSRLLVAGQPPGQIIGAGRWVLANAEPRSGFDTWADRGRVRVWLEEHTPTAWPQALVERGHRVDVFDHPAAFGHAHLIERTPRGWAGAADPRARGLASGR